MSQVKNRRENIFIGKPPVEILDIDAIETKLDTDGYLKADDLPIATSEVAGMVKVGEGLSVAEDGTLSATGGGGMEVTLLKEGSGSLSDNYTEVTLEDDYDKYYMLVVCVGNNGKNSTGNAYFFVPWLSLGALQDNVSNASAWTVSIRAVVVDSEVVKNKLNVKTSTTAQAWSIYGIK